MAAPCAGGWGQAAAAAAAAADMRLPLLRLPRLPPPLPLLPLPWLSARGTPGPLAGLHGAVLPLGQPPRDDELPWDELRSFSCEIWAARCCNCSSRNAFSSTSISFVACEAQDRNHRGCRQCGGCGRSECL